MSRAHQLEATLRNLRLSGMVDTLDARLSQARAGELDHLEFLAMLCEDEIARRDATALERRLKAARFETTANLEEYDFTYNPKVPPSPSATWPPYASSTPASQCSCMDRSMPARP